MPKPINKAKPGDTVVYSTKMADCAHYDQVIADQHLTPNREYTVIEVCYPTPFTGSKYGAIKLEKFPNQWFNMSLFTFDSDELCDLCIKNEYTEGWVKLTDATQEQLVAEIRGMYKLVGQVDKMTSKVNKHIKKWKNS